MNYNNEYKPSQLPEVVAGQTVMSKADEIIDGINILNSFYFKDKPYYLELTGNFDPTMPMYDISISTKGYGFSVFGLNDLAETTELLKLTGLMLRNKKLGKYMLDNSFGEGQELGRYNFIKYVLKAK